MPAFVMAARILSIVLVVLCALPILSAKAVETARIAAPQPRSGAARGLATCPPRWPYIVLTCVA